MCTISWMYRSQGYSVFFNRDEQRSRPKAIPPHQICVDSVNYIAPIDPQGKGTWCAVNEYGMTFALLNFYQGKYPKGALFSRGQIINGLVTKKSLREVDDAVNTLRLQRYAPFSLLIFSIEEKNDNGKVVMYRWNGRELLTLSQSSPLISSAMDYDGVYTARMGNYWRAAEIAGGLSSDEQFIELHSSHRPDKSAYSFCMHRDDAETQSLSHVFVSEFDVKYDYHNGAPCCTQRTNSLSLSRKRSVF